jgi:hypothetical protein
MNGELIQIIGTVVLLIAIMAVSVVIYCHALIKEQDLELFRQIDSRLM